MLNKSLLFLLLLIFSSKLDAQTLSVQLSTQPQVNGQFEKVYVLGVWIEDESGNFVTSLIVYGNKYKRHLKKWNEKSSNSTVNAVTGATISENQTHNITWNCKKSDAIGFLKGQERPVVRNQRIKEWEIAP